MQTRSQKRNANLTETPSAAAIPSDNREQVASQRKQTASNMAKNSGNKKSDPPATQASANQETPSNLTVHNLM